MKRIAIRLLLVGTLSTLSALAQAPKEAAPDPFKDLSFLEQNWEANTNGFGDVKSVGTYTFRPELGGHILARRSTSEVNCKGPADFDCGHGDMLYIFVERPGAPLKAIYFDNEGHVIYYDVSVPEAGTVVFLSEPGPGPQFRLTYALKGAVMVGKFQMQMPGGTEWKSYLEWSGGKVK